jgi:hypothetical protein
MGYNYYSITLGDKEVVTFLVRTKKPITTYLSTDGASIYLQMPVINVSTNKVNTSLFMRGNLIIVGVPESAFENTIYPEMFADAENDN